MATGYEAIDELQNQTNQMYNEQQKQQNNIIDISTQQAVSDLERNKQKTDQELLKTNRALYTDYQKQINPYGVNSERLAEQGLANSGLAETTKANYYNTYQTARTEATNNANTIKADFDADIVKARQNGDIQKAQSALELYKQKIADLSNFYNLRFNVDQFNYQKQRDTVADSQWQQEYNLSKSQWDKQFKYQKSRDKVADKQWQQQFNLTKKKTGSSGSSGRRSSRKGSSGSKGKNGNTKLNTKDGKNKNWIDEVIDNKKVTNKKDLGSVIQNVYNAFNNSTQSKSSNNTKDTRKEMLEYYKKLS